MEPRPFDDSRSDVRTDVAKMQILLLGVRVEPRSLYFSQAAGHCPWCWSTESESARSPRNVFLNFIAATLKKGKTKKLVTFHFNTFCFTQYDKNTVSTRYKMMKPA